MFHDEKIYTARNFRKNKLLKLKRLNHVQSHSGKKKCNFKTGEGKTKTKQQPKKKPPKKTWSLLQMYTGDYRLREEEWKILHNIYRTNILFSKLKVKENNKCSTTTTTTTTNNNNKNKIIKIMIMAISMAHDP